jgi:hypothetical protein
MLVFALLGHFVDRRIGGNKDTFTLVGLFLGLFYGGYEVWKVVRALQRQEDAAAEEENAPSGPDDG